MTLFFVHAADVVERPCHAAQEADLLADLQRTLVEGQGLLIIMPALMHQPDANHIVTDPHPVAQGLVLRKGSLQRRKRLIKAFQTAEEIADIAVGVGRAARVPGRLIAGQRLPGVRQRFFIVVHFAVGPGVQKRGIGPSFLIVRARRQRVDPVGVDQHRVGGMGHEMGRPHPVEHARLPSGVGDRLHQRQGLAPVAERPRGIVAVIGLHQRRQRLHALSPHGPAQAGFEAVGARLGQERCAQKEGEKG